MNWINKQYVQHNTPLLMFHTVGKVEKGPKVVLNIKMFQNVILMAKITQKNCEILEGYIYI